jgi:hypothetical protein
MPAEKKRSLSAHVVGLLNRSGKGLNIPEEQITQQAGH